MRNIDLYETAYILARTHKNPERFIELLPFLEIKVFKHRDKLNSLDEVRLFTTGKLPTLSNWKEHLRTIND